MGAVLKQEHARRGDANRRELHTCGHWKAEVRCSRRCPMWGVCCGRLSLIQLAVGSTQNRGISANRLAEVCLGGVALRTG
jgi:hypothetical protein